MQREDSANSTSESLIDKLIDYEFVSEGATYFANKEFEDAIIGVTDDGRFVYDFWKMVESTMKDSDCDADEAFDYVSSGVANFVPAMGGKYPVIFYGLDDLEL